MDKHQNCLRLAYTMIELVFVIVVIGLLSSLAFSRFNFIVEDARLSKLHAFTDLLNRSVGPLLWSSILRDYPFAHGSLKDPALASVIKYNTIFDQQTTLNVNKKDAQVDQIPIELTTNADGVTGAGTTHDIPLSNCADAGTLPAPGVGRIASAKIGNTVYNIGCIDGNEAISPHFFLDDGTQILTR